MKFVSAIKYALKESYVVLGFFSVIVGIVCIIDINEFVVGFWQRLLLVAAIFGLSFAAGLIKVLVTKKVALDIVGNHKVEIMFGDIFAHNGVLVIPANRYFDTCVDERVVSVNSVHGQFIKELFGGNVSELEAQIEKSLRDQAIAPVDKNLGKQGESDAYPIGSIAEVTKGAQKYYMLALTDCDEHNVACCTLEQYYQAVIKLLDYIKQNSQGREVALPLLGGGFARMKKSKSDILANLLSIIRMYDGHITSDIKIILGKKDKSYINLHDLK